MFSVRFREFVRAGCRVGAHSGKGGACFGIGPIIGPVDGASVTRTPKAATGATKKADRSTAVRGGGGAGQLTLPGINPTTASDVPAEFPVAVSDLRVGVADAGADVVADSSPTLVPLDRVLAWAVSSCAAQGVEFKISDPDTIATIAVLFGATDTR